MTEGAVLNRGRETTPSGGPSAAGARVFDDCLLSPGAAPPRASWLRRAVQASVRLVRNEVQPTLPSGLLHWMVKGEIKRGHLRNGGRIRCQKGKVWITADGGGEDVVLSGGEFRWFRPGDWVLVEAIAASEIIVEA